MEVAFSDARVAVVGLGLMGGSLCAALRTRGVCREVIGVARHPATLQMARDLRFIDRGATDLAEGLRDADVVVLATPVRDILDKLAIIGPMLKPGGVVMDIGSTKTAICEAMAALPDGIQPLGGHPMCGKETSGLAMADPTLYRDRVFALVPLPRTTPETLEVGRALALGIGARPLVIDAAREYSGAAREYSGAARHDRLVAAISHLPFMLASALVEAAAAVAEGDPLAWQLAAGGFYDTSRLAASDPTMMLDILATNRDEVLRALREARGQLDYLARLLEDGDLETLRAAIEAARNRRMEIFP
jgi:prephenate dehydrogenase